MADGSKHMNLELTPFAAHFAPTIASWVSDDLSMLWLAPRTPPPLTPAKVLDWHGAGKTALLAQVLGEAGPCGYAEINQVRSRPYELWLGHIIVAPQRRGRGIGSRFVDLLLDKAFEAFGAQTVSLVVFPENVAAVRCYQGCGFTVTRDECHRFRRGGPMCRMLRLDIERQDWLRRAAHRAAAGTAYKSSFTGSGSITENKPSTTPVTMD